MDSPSRRELLGTAGAATAIGVAGCSSLLGSDEELTLEVLNTSESPQTAHVEFLMTGGDGPDPSGGEELTVDVPPSDAEGAGVVRREAVVPVNQYLVRVDIEGVTEPSTHYHFYPKCDDNLTDILRISIHHGGDPPTYTYEFFHSCGSVN